MVFKQDVLQRNISSLFYLNILNFITTGVNFTEILLAPFLHEIFAQSFIVLTFEVWAFLAQKYWSNCVLKMFVKLATDFHVLFPTNFHLE